MTRRRDELTADERRWLAIGAAVEARRELKRYLRRLRDEAPPDDALDAAPIGLSLVRGSGDAAT